ncbi:MAG: ATP-binding protein, partial [Gammaproteobacteria bacterium]|nr:ATP-binding protein [Gammaproteobacteria bacterium]
MIPLLQEMMLDFQQASLQTGVKRHIDIMHVTGKATVAIGVRRAGKSTLMHQIIANLLKSHVDIENVLYLNFFDDRLYEMQHMGLDVIIEAYFMMFPHKKNSEKIYCFFDEIQIVPGWESFINRIMRTEQCEVYITGSSANLLSKEIATQLRGRALAWEVFPFSFKEYLDFQQTPYEKILTSKSRLLIQKQFSSYWICGGFPEVFDLPDSLRIKIHQSYFETILFRDLIERHNITHPKALIDLAYWLIHRTGSLYSINKLTGYLKSLGHKVPKNVVSDFLKWFEDAYFFFTVNIYDASLARVSANPKKIYSIDHAFVSSIASGILLNQGHLLENLIFIALRRVYPLICYYKTTQGREVDFIVQNGQRQ